jgi:hypothetical protein
MARSSSTNSSNVNALRAFSSRSILLGQRD